MKQHAAPQPRAAQAPKARAPAPAPPVATEAALAGQEAIRDILRADAREAGAEAGGTSASASGDGDGVGFGIGVGVGGDRGGLIRRACRACGDEELRRAPSAHGPPAADHGSSVNAALGRDIQASRPSGRPLPVGLRQGFENRFAASLDGVRVITGESAGRLNDSLHSRAFTVGNHIWFGRGEYQPESSAGQRLLAHELTHTLQQGPSPSPSPQAPLRVGSPNDPAEAEADHAAHAAMQGGDVRLSIAVEEPVAEGPVLRRQELDEGVESEHEEPAPDPGSGPDGDCMDLSAYPGWSFRPIGDEYESRPTLAEAEREIQLHDPSLIPLLLDDTVSNCGPPIGGYTLFRHPTAGVVARARWGLVSGSDSEPDSPGIYRVLLFQPESGSAGSREDSDEGALEEGTSRARVHDPLMELYNRHYPPEPGGSPVTRTDQAMRLRLALSLADRGFFGSIYDAAMEAIQDPLFIIQTVLMIGIYVGLWLTPDPSLITKVLAAGVTVMLLALFAWHDIIGFARAWFRLEEAAETATTEEELHAAGNEFMRELGRVGFDIFLMIVMWGMGRAARGPLRAARGRIASDATARAAAGVLEAESRPGSGGTRPAPTAVEAQVVEQARTAAGEGATPTRILDALANLLPESAREGLAAERAPRGRGGTPETGDARALAALEGRTRGGADLFRWLEERAMPAEETAAARQALADAQARLARARMVELRSLEDFPSGRGSMLTDLLNILMDLGRALRRLSTRFQRAVLAADVNAIIGELGEALARGQLTQRLLPGQEVVTSLELARRVPGFRTVAEWAAAERAAGRDPHARLGRMRQGPDGVYESVGQVDNAVAERLPDGRLRILSLEETKTGSETAASALEQVEGVRNAMAEIEAGTTDVRIFERPNSTTVGADITADFDLSRGAAIEARTRGPEGRTGFDESLGATREDLAAVAGQIIAEGIPPGEPGAHRLIETSDPGGRERSETPEPVESVAP